MSSTDDELEDSPLSYLESIPVEIFLHICSYLDSKYSLLALSKVCTYFNKILNDDFIWKSRIGRRWLPINNEEVVRWRQACDSIEAEAPFLTKPLNVTQTSKFEAHCSDIHAVHILEGNKICLTGSRDHDMAVWDMDNTICSKPIFHNPSAHNAWVWRITSRSPEEIFSCGFDNFVKHWSLTPSSLQEVTAISCDNAVMSIQLLENQRLIAAGLTKGVVLIDERSKTNPVHIFAKKKHTQLALASVGPHTLIATGLNRSLTICDLRTNIEQESSFKICEYPGHPQCMAEMRGLLYVGDTEGQLHMVEVNGEDTKILQTYKVGHKENFLTIGSSYTSLITGSSVGNIRFWRHQHPLEDWEGPYRPLETVGMIQPNQDELCAMHFRDGVLAATMSRRSTFNYWMPKKQNF